MNGGCRSVKAEAGSRPFLPNKKSLGPRQDIPQHLNRKGANLNLYGFFSMMLPCNNVNVPCTMVGVRSAWCTIFYSYFIHTNLMIGRHGGGPRAASTATLDSYHGSWEARAPSTPLRCL